MSLLKKFKSKGVEIKKINWIFIVLVCCFCFFVFRMGNCSKTSMGFSSIRSLLSGQQKKPSVHIRTEGAVCAVPPHHRYFLTDSTLTASDNAYRCIGRPRPALLDVQAGHSGRYLGVLSCSLTPTGNSLEERRRLLHPFTVLTFLS